MADWLETGIFTTEFGGRGASSRQTRGEGRIARLTGKSCVECGETDATKLVDYLMWKRREIRCYQHVGGTHGTVATYHRGCRCGICFRANRDRRRERLAAGVSP